MLPRYPPSSIFYPPLHRGFVSRFCLCLLAIGTLAATRQPTAEQKLIAAIEKAGGTVRRDDKAPGRPVYSIMFRQGAAVGPDVLDSLPTLTGLRELMFLGTPIADADAAKLARNANLEILWFLGQSDRLTNEGLRRLAPLTKLRRLLIHNASITNAGLDVLETWPNLESLALSGTKISDDGLAHVQRLTHLDSLYLDNTSITDADVAALAKLTNLRKLQVHHTHITDQATTTIARLSNLTDLWISETAITDAGLANLKPLTHLRVLAIYGTKVTDTGVSGLKDLSALNLLFLDTKKYKPQTLAALRKSLPTLRITDPPPKATPRPARPVPARISPARPQRRSR